VRERESERERKREIERETDRERQTERETECVWERETERKRERERESWKWDIVRWIEEEIEVWGRRREKLKKIVEKKEWERKAQLKFKSPKFVFAKFLGSLKKSSGS